MERSHGEEEATWKGALMLRQRKNPAIPAPSLRSAPSQSASGMRQEQQVNRPAEPSSDCRTAS